MGTLQHVTITKYLGFRIKFEQNLEQTLIGIGIDVNPLDIEVCHRPTLGRNATKAKRVIVKLFNRKHSEAILQRKKDINQKSKVFVSHSLCPYYLNCREKVGLTNSVLEELSR